MTSRFALGLRAVALSVLLSACNGNVVVSGGTGGGGTGTGGGGTGTGGTGTTGTSTGGTGGSNAPGDCQSSADCEGKACIELTPGGFKICDTSPPEATKCDPEHASPDECCTSADPCRRPAR